MTAAATRLTSNPTPAPAPRGACECALPFKRPYSLVAPRPAAAARRSRRLLYLFSGPPRRRDGVAALAAATGFDTDEVDLLSGDATHDMSEAANRARVLQQVRDGRYAAVLIATPCKSFSVARGNSADGSKRYGLRSEAYPSGPPWMSDDARAFIEEHDGFVDLSIDVLEAALELDMDFILENPAPRDNPDLDSSWPARSHLLQVWRWPRMRDWLESAGDAAKLVVVPQCAFGPTPSGKLFQKYTGLLMSRRVAARLADLAHLTCNHTKHDDTACGENSELAAAYPVALNDVIVRGLTGTRRTDPLPSPVPPLPPLAGDATGVEATPRPPREREVATATATQQAVAHDRTISTGRLADGPALLAPVREAVEQARHKRRKWASFANLAPASEAELRAAPIPDLLPQAGRTEWPGPPSQPGADARLAEFKEALGRDVHIEDLWVPDEWARFQAWMRRARRGGHQASAYFPQSSLVPLARGYIWDTRNPRDCVPMAPSDGSTKFPGKRQLDRDAFRRAAKAVGSRDADIIGQVARGGVESRSRCSLTSELHSHAPGLWERPEAAAAAVDTEFKEEWALGPFFLPPTVPIRALPRDVIQQERSRVLEGGVVEDYLKDRITLNPSKGMDSVNSGIPKEEREVALTSARALGYALAVIDVPARDAGLGVAGYGVDMTSAYSFLPVQRLDWWQFAYIWFGDDGRAHFRLLIRVGFGGAMSPRRFQSVSVIVTAYAKLLQARFDEAHPPPTAVRRWRRARRELQDSGRLLDGADQATPSVAGVYIDDMAGGCCDDDVRLPELLHGVRTADVDLGELSAFAAGGKPLRRNSRPAAHCILAIAAIREVGLEETAGKTEGGDVFVNLGLRLRVREGVIDCPGPKRRILMRDLDRWRESVDAVAPFKRAMAQRQVGRIVNLTQVLPELLVHVQAGYRAANAGYVAGGRRRAVAEVPMARGSSMHAGLSRLLPHALAVLERNEGVPLAPRAAFAARDDPGVLLVVTDASGHDGGGGWAFLGSSDMNPVVVSEPWPSDVREALRQFKLRERERTPGAALLSMPAAELFIATAVAAAAAEAKPHAAVIAVGDCEPAAFALDAASSSTPQVDALLAAARARARQWLGVPIPREWNLDADRLSHPAQRDAVLAEARAAGLDPIVCAIPPQCWQELREAMRLRADD